jgi:hypothetical protein
MFRIVVLIAATLFACPALSQKLSNDQIKQEIIRQSIASYPGNCPCPYSTMKNGRRCGGNSAHSRPGGRSPICYPSDVTDEMVEKYRKQHSR